MDNFQYSVQLSDQDWAEFSATAGECGLLQASLASGDELLSSDIDQGEGDSSGSSPPRPPPLLKGQPAPGGRGWPCFEEKDKVATGQLVSGSWCEPVLALEASQQTPSTSARSEAWPSLSSGQSLSLLGPASSSDKMQRLLQGPAPRGPTPTPTGEPPQSPEPPGHGAAPRKAPGSPGALPRSPSRKKRRAVGTKWGGRTGPPGSPLPTEARPEEALGQAGPAGKAFSVKPAGQVAEAGPEEQGLGPAEAPEQVASPGPGLDPSVAVPTTEQSRELLRTTLRAELSMVRTPAREARPDTSVTESDMPLSTPACKPPPDMPLSIPTCQPPLGVDVSTPACQPPPDMPLSTPACQPPPDVPLSTPACQPPPDVPLSTPACQPPPDVPLSTPACQPPLGVDVSTPVCQPPLGVDLPALCPGVKPEVDLSKPVSKATPRPAQPPLVSGAQSSGDVPPSVPIPQARPYVAELDLSPIVPPEGHQEKPRREPSAGAPGQRSGERPPGPVQVPKRKKVRFSVTEPSPAELRSGEALGAAAAATGRASAPRMAAGGPGAWDAVAVGPWAPQPRILKHLPPPAPSALEGPGPRSSFAVSLPEAYEFFFCDTIEEEDEGAEDAAEAGLDPVDVQWPDACEFFFRDCRAQTSGTGVGHCPALSPQAGPAPSPLPEDPVPIIIPEAYEHFLGEDAPGGVLVPATLLQLQALELARPVTPGPGPGAPPEPSMATAEALDLVVRRAGEPWGRLPSLNFSQKDMCLVFVAFATWAVRTSDLHTPDAWKTVLLANIGTISAIRYFRREAGRGRRGPSCSRSPSPSS